MTDIEIEFALKQYAAGGGQNVQNMDWAGMLDYINRLKASDESKEKCTIEQHDEIHRLRDELRQARAENEDMYGELMSLRAYIDNHEEIWKSNAQIENERFIKNMKNVLEIEKEQIRKDTAKEILQEVWDTGGTILAIQQLAAKYGVEIKK